MGGNMTDDWRLDNHFEYPQDGKISAPAMLEWMVADGGWFRFCEYDSLDALFALKRAGSVEYDPNWNNRHSSMVTSFRARAALRNHEASE